MDPGLRRIVVARLEADGSLGDGWGDLVRECSSPWGPPPRTWCRACAGSPSRRPFLSYNELGSLEELIQKTD